jgi:hypothetical protein
MPPSKIAASPPKLRHVYGSTRRGARAVRPVQVITRSSRPPLRSVRNRMAQPQRWWRPTSDADLLLAAQAGTLSENTPHLELEQEIETGAAANRELGRDLASFGVTDGSVFVPR